MGIHDYIKTLPMPLSKEEQQALLNIFYSTRKDDVRELLITHNLRLVASCVMKYQGTHNDLEDLMTIGTIELINVIDNKFDITKGVSFSTYAMKSIKLRLLDEIDIKNRSVDAIYQPHQSTIFNKDDEELDIFDTIADDTNFVDDVSFKIFIDKFILTLSDYEKFLFEQYFQKGDTTCRELEKVTNKSKSTINRDINSIKERLKYYLQTGKLKESEITPEMQSIIDFVNTTKNEKHKYVLEHLYGLNGNRVMSPAEINNALGCCETYTSDVLHKLRKSGKIITPKANKLDIQNNEEYVTEYYESIFDERERLIFAYSYGIDGSVVLKPDEIAKIVGISMSSVYRIKSKLEEGFKSFVEEKSCQM